MEPLVSVIVPVYNKKIYLKRCFDSIANQDYGNFEVIVVDDGSTDGSSEICDEYANSDSRFKVTHQPNGGVSKARNVGVKNSNGDFIVFVDGDDYVTSKYISYMVEKSNQTQAQIVQCDMQYVLTSEDVSEVVFEGTDKVVSGKNAILSYEYKVSPCAKLFSRGLFEGIEYPEGLVYEDEATYYKLAFKCQQICIVPARLYCYYKVENSITHTSKINFDFIPVCLERIEFFKDKNDSDLLDNAYERYAVILMLNYAKCIKFKAEKDIKKRLIYLYKDNYKFLNKKSIKARVKLLLILHRYFPNITATIVGVLRRNR